MKKMMMTALLVSGLAAAQGAAPVTPAGLPAGVPATLPKQVHIAIGEIKCPFSGCSGDALAGALTDALMQADNFAVYERVNLQGGLQEGMLSGSIGSDVKGADVMVTGTVTAFGEDSSGVNGCVLGIFCGGQKKQRITINLRIFDVKTSRLIGSAMAEGNSQGSSGSINFAGLQLGGNQSSGMDKAVAAMLNDAVQKLTAKIPASYYH